MAEGKISNKLFILTWQTFSFLFFAKNISRKKSHVSLWKFLKSYTVEEGEEEDPNNN